MDPNLPIKAYIQSCSLLYQRAMTSMSENVLELAFIYLLRAARVLVKDLPSKHPDYPLLTPNFQAALQAEQVGITQYINPCLPTFSAILKHRFTNFLVYEVDNQGQVVHLKDINDPHALEESQDKIVKSKPVSLECPVDSEVKLLEILCTSELEILKQFVSQGPPLNAKRYILGSTYPIQNPNHQFLVNYLMNMVFRLSLFNQASHPTDREGGGTNHESDRLKIENLEKRLEDLEIVKDLRSRPEIWKEIRWLKDLETQLDQRMQALNRDWERLSTKSSMNHREVVQGVDQNQTNQIRCLINQPGIEDNCVGMSDIREFTKSIAVQDLKRAREQESAAQRLEQDAQQKTSEMQVSTTTEEATDYVLAGFKKCYYSQLRQLSHYTIAFDGQKFPLKVEAG
ncbi:hypothetical protein PPACK8108_LOCUS722 [Phakopsora pachyrhizi]|uniref:Uncharacterized protein n=1 Tax=Phakopsora pachyrhizi TaxID=170000 RepID=A0AAV0AE66_PHAPC|nr:hypothetical protein PPACK8108_LOCUS722 [Phakopsora pachyrhizi]